MMFRSVSVNNGRSGCSYKEFLACNLKEYNGKGGAIAYARWIEKIESVHDMRGWGDNQKVKYSYRRANLQCGLAYFKDKREGKGSKKVLIGRQMKTELKLKKKFQELCEEETVRLLRRVQNHKFDKMTRIQMMVNESYLGVREKHTFVSNMNLGTLVGGQTGDQDGQRGDRGNGANRGVDEVPDFFMVIAQQLQNLLPTIIAQVGNHASNIQGDVRSVSVSNGRSGCSYKEFMACNLKDYNGKGGAIAYTRWIEKMESVHDMSGCGDNQKVKYTAGSFIGKALTW
ncbi:hypothetical protein Tco_1406153 [Tanacetum coccineum]